ncbi:MAG: hypothetical protein IKD69_00080 [Solobacterium sp.]|nr:hypothetical protein [Solobacterium sp.]
MSEETLKTKDMASETEEKGSEENKVAAKKKSPVIERLAVESQGKNTERELLKMSGWARKYGLAHHPAFISALLLLAEATGISFSLKTEVTMEHGMYRADAYIRLPEKTRTDNSIFGILSRYSPYSVIEFKSFWDDLSRPVLAKGVYYKEMLSHSLSREDPDAVRMATVYAVPDISKSLLDYFTVHGKIELEKLTDGVYSVSNYSADPVYIVTYGKLKGKENALLRIFTRDAGYDDYRIVAEYIEKMAEEGNEIGRTEGLLLSYLDRRFPEYRQARAKEKGSDFMTVREDCLSRYFEVVDEKLEMEKTLEEQKKALEDQKRQWAAEKENLEDTVKLLREKIDELEKNSGSGLSAGQSSVLPALAEIGRQVKKAAGRFGMLIFGIGMLR